MTDPSPQTVEAVEPDTMPRETMARFRRRPLGYRIAVIIGMTGQLPSAFAYCDDEDRSLQGGEDG